MDGIEEEIQDAVEEAIADATEVPETAEHAAEHETHELTHAVEHQGEHSDLSREIEGLRTESEVERWSRLHEAQTRLDAKLDLILDHLTRAPSQILQSPEETPEIVEATLEPITETPEHLESDDGEENQRRRHRPPYRRRSR